jgi:ATP-dependent Clp protease ATP-binding subunit ClpA
MPSYSRYSHHARRALTHAGLLVKRYHHPGVDTGHLLVGVMLTKGSVGYTVLEGLDLDADKAWLHLESMVTPVERQQDPPVHEASLDKALELASDEAAWLGHHYIGTEHLLLGITRTNEGNASTLLSLLNVAPEQVRHRVRRALNDGLTEYSLQQARRNVRLSELSRRVIYAAEQVAVTFDHETVGLGHLILVLMREHRSSASALLRNAINEAEIQAALDEKDPMALVSIEGIIMLSEEHAQKLGSHYTGTEHLLLALLGDQEGARLLTRLGAKTEQLRQVMEETLRKKR